jgi:hypothetical protein
MLQQLSSTREDVIEMPPPQTTNEAPTFADLSSHLTSDITFEDSSLAM